MNLPGLLSALWPRAEVKRLRAQVREHQVVADHVFVLEGEVVRLRTALEESRETAIFCLQKQVDWYARRVGGPSVYHEPAHSDDPQTIIEEQRVSHKLPGRVAVREANRRWIEEIRKQIQLKADQQEAQQEAPANADGD